MSAARRWGIRLATALGIAGVLWLVAFASSIIPTVVALTTNVHGLALADYSVSTARRLAPLSGRIVQEALLDHPSPSPTPRPGPSPSSPTPSPSPSSPIPSLPTVPPLPTGTPTVTPLPTLPTPPPLP